MKYVLPMFFLHFIFVIILKTLIFESLVSLRTLVLVDKPSTALQLPLNLSKLSLRE